MSGVTAGRHSRRAVPALSSPAPDLGRPSVAHRRGVTMARLTD